MKIAAHDADFAKAAKIPQSVARDFYEADKRAARRGAIKKAFAKAKAR